MKNFFVFAMAISIFGLSNIGAEAVVDAFELKGGDQIYFFADGGKKYVAYTISTKTWSTVYNTKQMFGSTIPLNEVSATFTLKDGDQIYFFDGTGTNYVAYTLSTKTWSKSASVAQMFGGGNPLASVGASFEMKGGDQIYFFDKSGTQYAAYTISKKEWTKAVPTKGMFGGTSPFEAVGTTFSANKGDQLYFFDLLGDNYAVYTISTKTWTRTVPITAAFGGGFPKELIKK